MNVKKGDFLPIIGLDNLNINDKNYNVKEISPGIYEVLSKKSDRQKKDRP